MECIDRQFAQDKKELDDVLTQLKIEQEGCDVIIKVERDTLSGYWVCVYV